MNQSCFIKSFICAAVSIFSMAVIAGCGSQSHTGHNGQEHRKERASRKNKQNPKDVETSLAADEYSCIGSAIVDTALFEEYCASIIKKESDFSKKINKIICEEKKLANLFLPECAWNGKGSAYPYIQVLESTAIDDKRDSFYYLVAYAMNLEQRGKSFSDLTFLAYSDPRRFTSSGYKIPENAVIFPQNNTHFVAEKMESLEYLFHFESSLGATRFRSKLTNYTVDKTRSVMTDRATADFLGIKSRQNLTFSVNLPKGRVQVVSIEEREVPDYGKHDIALKKSISHDIGRMEVYYENSLVD